MFSVFAYDLNFEINKTKIIKLKYDYQTYLSLVFVCINKKYVHDLKSSKIKIELIFSISSLLSQLGQMGTILFLKRSESTHYDENKILKKRRKINKIL